MFRKLVIPSVVLFLIHSPVALAQPATVYAWFDAIGLNPQSGVSTQGVEGGDLGLTCDTTGGPAVCEWRINMRTHNLEQVTTMGTELLGDTSLLAISDATQGDFPGAGFPNQGHHYKTPNAGGVLAILRDLSIPLGNPDQGAPGFYNPVSFTLMATKPVGDQSLHLIDARIDSLLWTQTTGFAVVAFGDAPPIPGNIAGGIAPGVIQIQSVPEPATGIMLFAAIAVVARRSRQSRRLH